MTARRTTRCACGHDSSQHHATRTSPLLRVCDYFGYACECSGYTRPQGPPDDPPEPLPRRYVLVDLRSIVGNCASFWAEGRGGYTCELDGAHVFTEEEAFRQHRCRPHVDWPVPVDVARSLVVQHVRVGPMLDWARANQDPRREDPYGAQPREESDGG